MKTLYQISIFTSALLASLSGLFATNGMNLEGYGPVSLGQGGTALAAEETTAAVMNNPATLILQNNKIQLDIALGYLGPQISTVAPDGSRSNSKARDFYMPAIGYIWKSGNFATGFGLFGQGGMGTDYGNSSFLSVGSGRDVESCVSVGRFIVPLAYRINEKFTIAGSIDFVWAGMNLEMPLSGQQFADLTTPSQMNMGYANGTLLQSMMPFMMAGYQLDWAHFNFTTDSQFYGEARGTGFAAKIGFLYEVNDKLMIGATYHTKTNLSDLKTSDASMSFQLSNSTPPPGYPPIFPAEVKGKISVNEFEWPTIYGVGIKYQLNERWKLMADIKTIQWKNVMKDFEMLFTANSEPKNNMTQMGGPNMQGQHLTAVMYQNWKNQTVIALGAAYQANKKWTLRFGLNHGNNPIPSQYTNPLFPATVETHLTSGFTYQSSDSSRIDFGLSYALKETVKIPIGMNMFMINNHQQINAQLSYNLSW